MKMETRIMKIQGSYLIQEPGEIPFASNSPGRIADYAIKLTKTEIVKALKTLDIGDKLFIDVGLSTDLEDHPDPGTD